MHEQIFIGVLIFYLLQLVLLSWRYVICREVPPMYDCPRLTTGPTRKKKGPRAQYPVGFC